MGLYSGSLVKNPSEATNPFVRKKTKKNSVTCRVAECQLGCHNIPSMTKQSSIWNRIKVQVVLRVLSVPKTVGLSLLYLNWIAVERLGVQREQGNE